MAIIKKIKNKGKDVGEKESLYVVNGNVISAAMMEISMEECYSTLGHIPKGM
jgi:hypothetical protein